MTPDNVDFANFTRNALSKLWLWMIVVKYAEQHDTHSTTTLLSRHIPPYPQNASLLESLVQYILRSIKPCKMSRYKCVCGSVCKSFSIGAFSSCMCKCFFSDVYMCAVNDWKEKWVFCVCSAQSEPVGTIFNLITLYEINVRRVRFVHCMTLMHSYSAFATAAKRPLMESRHRPNTVLISTRADAHPHIHNHRDTHKQCTQWENGGTHLHWHT